MTYTTTNDENYTTSDLYENVKKVNFVKCEEFNDKLSNIHRVNIDWREGTCLGLRFSPSSL